MIFLIAVSGICCAYLFSGKKTSASSESNVTEQSFSADKQSNSIKSGIIKQQNIKEIEEEKEEFTNFINMKMPAYAV